MIRNLFPNFSFRYYRSTIVFVFLFSTCFELNAQGIFVNKAGYLIDSGKNVFFNHYSDSFFVFNNQNSLIYKNSLVLLSQNDPSTGLTTYIGNFSDLKIEGTFYIKGRGTNRSSVFKISDSVYKDLFEKSIKAFYYQRCGTSLFNTHAGIYQHPVCHKFDGFFHPSSDTSGFKLTTGGWHDAGDFGKYVVNAGITAGTLLFAFEIFPELFQSDMINIPESGNNIPDLLDEIKFELDWLLMMQSPTGGVYTKLTTETFPGFIMPQNDNALRYIYEISSAATGNFAAVMAMAYRVFKSFNQNFAESCLLSARKAWVFLEKNPNIVPLGGFKNPLGTNTGEYGDNNDLDERLWAAVELFRSTGELVYSDYINGNYKKRGTFSNAMNWQNVNSLAQLSYLFEEKQQVNTSIKNELRNALVNYCNNILNIINQNGLKVALNPGDYNWGSNSEVLNRALLLIAAYKLIGNQSYLNGALAQLNYILGINAHDISFVTGVGDKHTMKPHHRQSIADGIYEPVPGLLAGGPDQYLNDNVLKSKFNSSTPPALCYADDENSYASNEIAINWNAPLVFVAGFFNGLGIKVSAEEIGDKFPEDYKLEQNYPNPFNPETTINYSIPFQHSGLSNIVNHSSVIQNVSLKIYDTLGRELLTVIDDSYSPGNYSVSINLNSFASGIYFYRLIAGNFSVTKKMILLR
jgi:endoglucanase